MNCTEVQELLSAYCDAELVDDQRSRVSCHLEECSVCDQKLAAFKNLSHMAKTVETPVPPEHLWRRIEEQLDQQPKEGQPKEGQLVSQSVVRSRTWTFSARRQLALAATVLVAAGIGWFAFQARFADSGNNQFTSNFGHYLDEFHHDPDAAQQILLAKYEHQRVDPDQAIHRVGYRPVVANGLPEGYTLESTHVVKMPCCTCVQSVCKRSDGSTLAIFEHDDDETTDWFGDRPEIRTSCHDKKCCLIELDDQIAASWQHNTRHVTLVGVRDVAEVSQMVAWLDETK